MIKESTIENKKKHSVLVRIGGLAILFAIIIHIILNITLKTFPSTDFTLTELQSYLTDESGTWALVHGMRYVAIACIAIFSAGLFEKTCNNYSRKAIGWGVVGLIGTALWLSNLMITNGIEILAFYDFHRISEQESLFWLLFNLTRVLFNAEIASWALFFLGFSMAGWISNTLSKWIVVLGLLGSLFCMLSAIFIVSILNDGWAVIFTYIAAFIGLVWQVSISVIMMKKS